MYIHTNKYTNVATNSHNPLITTKKMKNEMLKLKMSNCALPKTNQTNPPAPLVVVRKQPLKYSKTSCNISFAKITNIHSHKYKIYVHARLRVKYNGENNATPFGLTNKNHLQGVLVTNIYSNSYSLVSFK